MKWAIILFIILGAIAPRTLCAQNNNRISIQTGLFHAFFDQTPIVNNVANNYKRTLRNMFKGFLLDSKGIQYQRTINKKSAISIEFMMLNASYMTNLPLNNEINPTLIARNLKTINISYIRNVILSNHFRFVYGGGCFYRWGFEEIFISNHYMGGWWEAHMKGYYRNDLGINTRVGIEYAPIKWLTLYSNIDFMATTYLGASSDDGNAYKYYKDNYDRTDLPSRFDLSLRFGVGFNFN